MSDMDQQAKASGKFLEGPGKGARPRLFTLNIISIVHRNMASFCGGDGHAADEGVMNYAGSNWITPPAGWIHVKSSKLFPSSACNNWLPAV